MGSLGMKALRMSLRISLRMDNLMVILRMSLRMEILWMRLRVSSMWLLHLSLALLLTLYNWLLSYIHLP